ncbi:pyrroloquinoline quinone (PQQ) biosynthesis protein C [Sagittula marina]|uniref:Pyrroloquinoline quinone (PQQ) biosynthesis protein C n=1 Tax=Sagittula marina TaxID=943940 RepID=A0A7W6DSY7_9RHOB|nr:hypothetical protein [Sagittula marina]MBB3986145.1 pyrroloquinoline quinone (PQQ) biosynthesis protein C [Sagittula marina]
MTLDKARAILASPSTHDDAEIRDAARLVMEQGTPEEIRHARHFRSFGQRHGVSDSRDGAA